MGNANNKIQVLNTCSYTVIHRQTVSLYHNPLVWQDTRDAFSWDRSPAGFTSVRYLFYPRAIIILSVSKEIFNTYIYLPCDLLYCKPVVLNLFSSCPTQTPLNACNPLYRVYSKCVYLFTWKKPKRPLT